MNKTKNFNPNLNMDVLNMEDNKQFFHQLNHLSVLVEIKDQNYGKNKKLQQGTNLNKKNYAKTKINKNKKRTHGSKARTLRIVGVCGLVGGMAQIQYLNSVSRQIRGTLNSCKRRMMKLASLIPSEAPPMSTQTDSNPVVPLLAKSSDPF